MPDNQQKFELTITAEEIISTDSSFSLNNIAEGDVAKTMNENKTKTFNKDYPKMLLNSKNIIFRGAPGTGKSYLAKKIAAYIISGGKHSEYAELTKEEKEQVEFVQFHPSYDYSDFVEGIRPKLNDNGDMTFERQDGVFMSFVKKARENLENSLKTEEELQKELSIQEKIEDFLEDSINTNKHYTTLRKNKFSIHDFNNDKIIIDIPNNQQKRISIRKKDIEKLLNTEQKLQKSKDVTIFLKKPTAAQEDSYLLIIYQEIKNWRVEENRKEIINIQKEQRKPYIFIIDEINRGEISKIFGELFFSIDPGYRGKKGEITTQYYNLQEESNKEKFYIPENVYIIGTMNDIDRSVDTFDFAMRRRFRFIEIKANESLYILDELEDETKKVEASKRMLALNEAISDVTELNANYHIGAAYFLKLKELSFDELWEDCLLPLLQDYVRGMYDEEKILKDFKAAYNLENEKKDNENSEDKGQQ
ncbi:MAG: AAA family ATPase [Oscillospiraceae bacterium]|jgi:5-methylcytosine-specific restriction endonuclease McrBC GTP-binding regulatory subunit McrB|nr:AAA family ATPase [Oscillospiraceae bacterium]